MDIILLAVQQMLYTVKYAITLARLVSYRRSKR